MGKISRERVFSAFKKGKRKQKAALDLDGGGVGWRGAERSGGCGDRRGEAILDGNTRRCVGLVGDGSVGGGVEMRGRVVGRYGVEGMLKLGAKRAKAGAFGPRGDKSEKYAKLRRGSVLGGERKQRKQAL